jgi:hypothetical protein
MKSGGSSGGSATCRRRTSGATGEETVGVERESTWELLHMVKELEDGPVREWVRLLEGMLGEAAQPVGFIDWDAHWGQREKTSASADTRPMKRSIRKAGW